MMHEFMINIVCPFMGTMGYAWRWRRRKAWNR